MDQTVLEAIERWPDVPAVHGWLSLSRRGQWRLHPGGTASQGGFGESIQNQQIIAFINRNYEAENTGRWFFQNGPQRVYVRLDAAPLVASITGQPGSLSTHNGLPIKQIKRWLIDHNGTLFFECEHGPACVNDQDLELIVDALQTSDGVPLLDWCEQHEQGGAQTTVTFTTDAPFQLTGSAPMNLLGVTDRVENELGFVRQSSEN
ncbi:DUF2946 family protein [Orrella marina]|uniref:DUF2946 domain-containing protein n=1 Tax=Orrella marina TaxID=2163011 RepID=A0A2R4XK72_9BURK|nr:DUF2946 family protein [Orrella marina]AWB34186.1 DUF2946 domain-containing protein [Orrella marina]